MVKLIRSYEAANGKFIINATCLSSDEKPRIRISEESRIFETDTGIDWVWSDIVQNWICAQGGGGGGTVDLSHIDGGTF